MRAAGADSYAPQPGEGDDADGSMDADYEKHDE